MEPGPSKAAEALVGILIPPACRGHVLGDLRERNPAGWDYAKDAVRTVPLVILSRIRRTTDPQLLLMEAFALYLGFLAVPWLQRQWTFLLEQGGLLRLAAPVAVALVALVLSGAYADPKKRSALTPAWQASFGIACALLSQAGLFTADRDLAVPLPMLIYGSACGLILVSVLRFFFGQGDNRASGAG